VSARSKPPRVAKRPNPLSWDLDELMTLDEASALHWPDGFPLTSRSLRSAAESGVLGTVKITRKRLTTRRQVLEMSRCDSAAERTNSVPAKSPEVRKSHRMTAEEARAYMGHKV
jgi:hypothetical protein